MRRLPLVPAGVAPFVTALVLATLFPAALVLTVAAGPAAARRACVASATATYRHTFTGRAGTATVAAVAPLCAGQSQVFSLVSYTAGAGAQFVYDADRARIDSAHRSITLDVEVPRCATQVGALFGGAVLTEVEDASTAYGNARLGAAAGAGHRSSGGTAWYSGGASACVPEPTVTFASDCDGGFTATLANRAGAALTAVFLVDGRTYRVAPGTRTTVVGDGGGSLTVRDSAFQTSTGTWSQPGTCTQPTTPPTTDPVLTFPATGPAGPVPGGSSAVALPPGPAPVTSAGPSPAAGAGAGAAAGDPTFEAASPAAAESAASTAEAAVATSHAGSVAWITLGVLLIGGGVVILVRQIQQARRAR